MGIPAVWADDARTELYGTRERDNEDEKRHPPVSNLGQLLEPDTMDTSPSSSSVGIIDRWPSACLAKPGRLWPPGKLGP